MTLTTERAAAVHWTEPLLPLVRQELAHREATGQRQHVHAGAS
jgi:hypothetical protein